ncbi:MAG: hypothetical protein U5L11_01300 [Arhodomonas sp.]|nr:hypothetical protein [Arhodomonas sp.]
MAPARNAPGPGRGVSTGHAGERRRGGPPRRGIRRHLDLLGARGEAGDLRMAESAGAFDYDEIRADLAALARSEHRGRRAASEVTLFKSVGTALEDLAAAIAVWRAIS